MPELRCDVVVIGAGTAGLAAARAARRAGAATLLIDDRFAGTTCATVGCMPSKLLIAAADAAQAVRGAAAFGVNATVPEIDGAAVLKRLRHERDRFVQGVEDDFGKLPEGVKVSGLARFVDRSVLALEDGRRITARAIVIATGSRPSVPRLFDAVRACVLTNETVFDLATLPRSIGVVGAGPLGLELAQALTRLGVETVVFDEGRSLAGLKDHAAAGALEKILKKELTIHLGVKISAVPDGEGGVELTWTGDDQGRQCFDNLLLAVGRPPRLDGLDLSKAGLNLDEHGTPKFDTHTMQCGESCIFVAGDAAHDRPVLHEASDEGAIAGHNAATWPSVTPGRRATPLSIMFTDPAVAIVGVTPAADDETFVIGSADYADQGRARITGRNAGVARLYADARNGRLKGATIVAPGAEHMAHLMAWAIQQGLSAAQVLDLPFYHPTYEEGLRPALRAICDAVSSPIPDDRDEGRAPGS